MVVLGGVGVPSRGSGCSVGVRPKFASMDCVYRRESTPGRKEFLSVLTASREGCGDGREERGRSSFMMSWAAAA